MPDVTRVLPPADIERAFDLDEQLKHVDEIFGRVFQEVGWFTARRCVRACL